MNAYVVIMAGGTGTRFWPQSRASRPKQFLDILGTGKSFLQMTYDRFAAFVPHENIYISTNESYYALVQEQLPTLSDDQILLEPAKRNTAPCVAYACYKIGTKAPNAPIIIAPSDHVIFNEEKFKEAIDYAIETSDEEKLFTIGIKPTRPATGYGYINFEHSDQAVKKVKTFTEKPDLEVAKQFLNSGDYVWNAGIFVWTASAIRNAYREHLPKLDQLFDAISETFYTDKERDVIKTQYLRSEDISIDYGILEKSDNVYVVLGEFDWSDLGSWASLYEYREKDAAENVIEGTVQEYDVKKSLILGKREKMTVVQGLDGYVVVDEEDALLICEKDNEAVLKKALKEMKEDGKTSFS